MAFSDVWNRTLVYFGIAEEDDWDDELMTEEEVEQTYRRDRSNVRRLQSRRREQDDWTDGGTDAAATQVARPRLRGVEGAASPSSVKVHLVLPRSFNDAQQIADRFKAGVPVILNLQGAD